MFISMLVGSLIMPKITQSYENKQKRKNMVTKSKVRSIHSSLAIEANSLSLFDVENISQHKQIIKKKLNN